MKNSDEVEVIETGAVGVRTIKVPSTIGEVDAAPPTNVSCPIWKPGVAPDSFQRETLEISPWLIVVEAKNWTPTLDKVSEPLD